MNNDNQDTKTTVKMKAVNDLDFKTAALIESVQKGTLKDSEVEQFANSMMEIGQKSSEHYFSIWTELSKNLDNLFNVYPFVNHFTIDLARKHFIKDQKK